MAGFFGLFGKKVKAEESKAVVINRLFGGGNVLLNPNQVALHLNSVVMATVNWASGAFEAPVIAEKKKAGKWEVAEDHALTQLLENPNPYYSGLALRQSTAASILIEGNAYWHIVRNGAGSVRELWYLPSECVTAVAHPTENHVSHYEYRAKGKQIKIQPEDIVHFRNRLDTSNTLYGVKSLDSVLREILADNEISQYTQVILSNMGVPGVVITPKNIGDAIGEIEDGTGELFVQKFTESFTSNGRGKPMLYTVPLEIQTPGFTPKDLDVSSMSKALEARICSVLGVHPTVLGLSVGLERSTFNNMAEARKSAYESVLVPLQRLMASEINLQLLDQFGDTKSERIRFDNSEVSVLQEDQNDKATRLNALWISGAIKRSEVRAELGYEVAPEDEIFYTDIYSATAAETAKAEATKNAKLRASERRKAYELLDVEE